MIELIIFGLASVGLLLDILIIVWLIAIGEQIGVRPAWKVNRSKK